jgi:peptide/nickel transport system substrate-binding protein
MVGMIRHQQSTHAHRTMRHLGAAAVVTGLVLAACSSSAAKTGTATTAAAATSAATSAAPTTAGGSTATTAAGGTATTAGGSTATTAGPATTASPSTVAGGASDKSLVIARDMDINSLDPERSYCDTCQIFMTAVYETLIGLDPSDNKTLVPRLATKWESNSDQTQFTFHLDPKAKFADGNPVTSADVKFSWERLKGLQGSASYLVSTVDSIDASDPATVVVKMNTPNSAFLAQVNASYLGVVEAKVAQAQGATTDATTDKAEPWFLANSAGSGPFTLESYASGSELRLKRNDSWWGGKANFPEVIMKETKEAVAQRQQLEQGAVDIAMQISPDVAKDMDASKLFLKRVPSFNYVYLAVSPGAKGGEQLTEPVREAIRDALDYTGLLDVTVGGAGRPQLSPIPNGFIGSDGLPTPKQDVAKAKSLLQQAGVTSLTLDATYPSFNVYGVDFSTAMQKVQADLKAVGIELKLNPVEISVWADKIGKDGIPITMLYFAPDHTDPSQYVQYFGLLKDSQWQTWSKAPAVQSEADLLKQAFGASDDATKAKLYNQLALAMVADQIIIPVVNPDLYLAAGKDITGVAYSACCNLDLAKLGRTSG